MMIYNDNENSLANCIQFIETFEIFNNGEKRIIDKTNSEFEKIKSKLEDLFLFSRLMPAFGVSLHNETLKEIKANTWIQINFAKEQTKNGLKFNALVFKLEETQGFNLIRLYDAKYEGRCLFLDLEEEIDLMEIIK